MNGLIRFGDTVKLNGNNNSMYIIVSYTNPFIFLWNVKHRKRDMFVYGNMSRGKCVLIEKQIPESAFLKVLGNKKNLNN